MAVRELRMCDEPACETAAIVKPCSVCSKDLCRFHMRKLILEALKTYAQDDEIVCQGCLQLAKDMFVPSKFVFTNRLGQVIEELKAYSAALALKKDKP